MKLFSMDGFRNLIKSLGSSKDPRQQRVFQEGMLIDQYTADSLYTYNWLAAAVVDIPIDDATRKWRNILINDSDKKEEIDDVFKQFDIRGKINQAAKWGRVFGGAVIIMVVDGDQEEPLDIDNVKPGTLKNLIVLDRYQVTATIEDRNILSPNFGKPKFYQVAREGQLIHHTRVVEFYGAKPTIAQAEKNNFWGLSIFAKMWEPIGDSQEISGSIATMIHEANVDVYRIKDFNDLVANDEELATKRLKIIQEMKGIINGIVLDKEDEYTKKSNTFTTLPEIDDRGIQKVTGASGIPVTRLVGVSPGGMNATGESDMRNYYDGVQSYQENELRPKLDIIDRVVLGHAGHKDKFTYEFLPLQQLNEIEQSDVDLKTAQRDQIYLDQDLIDQLDVKKQLANKGTYVSIDGENIRAEEEELLGFELGEEESNTDPNSAFNGAQVTAILDIVTQVSNGELDKITASRMIATAFPVSEKEGLRMIENVEETKATDQNSQTG